MSLVHTVAHEVAHVIQQRGGVRIAGGVGTAGDAHEQHADAVADLVVRGASAEALLDRHAGKPAAATTAAPRPCNASYARSTTSSRMATHRRTISRNLLSSTISRGLR